MAPLSTSSADTDAPFFVDEPIVEPLAPDAPLRLDTFSKLAEALIPAVVRVIVHKGGGAGNAPKGHSGHVGQGTGFFINQQGYLLTNNHVVDEPNGRVEVLLYSGEKLPATIVGTDPETDLALLRVEPADRRFTVAPLGDSSTVRPGQWVLSIGAPFGLDHTVTAGIISATGRRNVRPDGEQRFYANFIQTDASINRGSSGGPLLDVTGRVIGVSTAINQRGQGIGFVIPVNMVKTLLPQLRKGHVERAWLGVRLAPVSEELAKRLGLVQRRGAAVLSIYPGSPAERAGLLPDDVIRELDGKEVARHDDLPWLTSTAGVGRKVEVRLVRAGKELRLSATLDAMPPEESEPKTVESAPNVDGPYTLAGAGVTVEAITPELVSTHQLTRDSGVVVTAVTADSPAGQAGVQPGDVLVHVNHRNIYDIASIRRHWGDTREGQLVDVTVERNGSMVYVPFHRGH